MAKVKTRQIEMYVGIAEGGGDCGSWSTDYVDIPADTAEDKIAEVAEKILRKEMEKDGTENVAFVGVYHVPDADEEEMLGEEE